MRIAFLHGFLCALLLACGGGATDGSATDQSAGPETTGAEEQPASSADDGSLGIPDEHDLPSGLITSGMPDRAALERARDAGITTVISLRTMEEPGASDEQAIVEELGMTFVSIPIAGADDVTEENARAVDEAIGDEENSTLLHCGSSNRAGAMVALRAFFVEGMAKEEALALGREAGLSRLEDAVAGAMDAHCEANPDSESC
jgi:uncharacterized protein (TIGR01244 family)